MEIRIDPHTLARAEERGAFLNEIEETLTDGNFLAAKQGRLAKSKTFQFEKLRNGKFYQEKKLEVYYVFENDIIITVTVYVFYGKF
ncbi:MAG: hypothetical protein JWQ30_76 [Sediminibacterium sp.]|nr:hypothetical protein [Sediminibacterium sp.]